MGSGVIKVGTHEFESSVEAETLILLACSSMSLLYLYCIRMKTGSLMFPIILCGSGQPTSSTIRNWHCIFIGMRNEYSDVMVNHPLAYFMSLGPWMLSGTPKYVSRIILHCIR